MRLTVSFDSDFASFEAASRFHRNSAFIHSIVLFCEVFNHQSIFFDGNTDVVVFCFRTSLVVRERERGESTPRGGGAGTRARARWNGGDKNKRHAKERERRGEKVRKIYLKRTYCRRWRWFVCSWVRRERRRTRGKCKDPHPLRWCFWCVILVHPYCICHLLLGEGECNSLNSRIYPEFVVASFILSMEVVDVKVVVVDVEVVVVDGWCGSA